MRRVSQLPDTTDKILTLSTTLFASQGRNYHLHTTYSRSSRRSTTASTATSTTNGAHASGSKSAASILLDLALLSGGLWRLCTSQQLQDPSLKPKQAYVRMRNSKPHSHARSLSLSLLRSLARSCASALFDTYAKLGE
jgi:hypothetical protein